MVLGAGAVVYTLMSNYEWGVIKVLPMPDHLALDAARGILQLEGILLAAFLGYFGFGTSWVPHIALGLVEIAAAATTERKARFETPMRQQLAR